MKFSDCTILFAGDDSRTQKTLERNFVKDGCRAVMADQVAGVLAELKKQKIDLLVADLGMDGMSSLGLLRILNREYPRLPIIVVTGRYRQIEEDFKAQGFVVAAFVNKPVDLFELKEKAGKILGIDGTAEFPMEARGITAFF